MSVEVFLSTLSLRRATNNFFNCRFNIIISIHALLAESDHTLSSRVSPLSNFYPRSPCGERHAGRFQPVRESGFLSTLSLRRATLHFLAVVRAFRISIHALLAESDAVTTVVVDPSRDFYPRSPCGERLKTPPQGSRSRIFLSTLSLRRATIQEIGREACAFISIHALLAESDALQQNIQAEDSLFLSTLSLRRATVRKNQVLLQYSRFLSTLSLRRATDGRNAISPVICISIHALLAESDSTKLPSGGRTFISIHALLAESDLSCNANINFTT